MDFSATAKSVSSYASSISRASGFASEQSDGDGKECYICLRSHGASDMIWPCVCRTNGSPRWVHRQCLDRWRRNAADPRYITECRDCRFRFRFIALQVSHEEILDKKRRRKKAIFIMLRNFLISLTLLQCGIATSALLVYVGDRDRTLPEFVFDDAVGDQPFISIYMTYYVVACLSFLFLFGIKIIFGWLLRGCRPSRRRRDPEANKDSLSLWCPEWLVCEYCDSWWFAASPICTEMCLHCCNPETLECRDCGTACSDGSSDVARCISCGHCAGISCDCNLSGEFEEMLMALVVVLIVLVVFGAVICVVGLIASVLTIFAYFRRIWLHYIELVVIKDLTQEFVVADLSLLLPAAPAPRLSTSSSVKRSNSLRVTGSPSMKDADSVKAFQSESSPSPETAPEPQRMRSEASAHDPAPAPIEAPAETPMATETSNSTPAAPTGGNATSNAPAPAPAPAAAAAAAAAMTPTTTATAGTAGVQRAATNPRLSKSRTFTRQFSSQRTAYSFNPELLAPAPASDKEKALQEFARDVIQEIRPFRASRRVQPVTVS